MDMRGFNGRRERAVKGREDFRESGGTVLDSRHIAPRAAKATAETRAQPAPRSTEISS